MDQANGGFHPRQPDPQPARLPDRERESPAPGKAKTRNPHAEMPGALQQSHEDQPPRSFDSLRHDNFCILSTFGKQKV